PARLESLLGQEAGTLAPGDDPKHDLEGLLPNPEHALALLDRIEDVYPVIEPVHIRFDDIKGRPRGVGFKDGPGLRGRRSGAAGKNKKDAHETGEPHLSSGTVRPAVSGRRGESAGRRLEELEEIREVLG